MGIQEMKDHAKIYAGLLIGLMMWWVIGTASFYMTLTMMHDESGIIHRVFKFYLIQNICFIVSGKTSIAEDLAVGVQSNL